MAVRPAFTLLPVADCPAAHDPIPYINRAALELIADRDIAEDQACAERVVFADERAAQANARAAAAQRKEAAEHSWWTVTGLPLVVGIVAGALGVLGGYEIGKAR